MSDVGVGDGIGAYIAGLAFVAIDMGLLVLLVLAIIVQLVRRKSLWNGVVLGLVVSIAMYAISAAGSFAASDYAATPSEKYFLFWAPSLLFFDLMAGVVSGVLVHRTRSGARG
jgi:hypothetical protein